MMNKKLLLISYFLFCSSLIAGESSSGIIQTNVPNIYVKNIMCDPQNNYRVNYSLVNKSKEKVGYMTVVTYDQAGDPIDNQKLTYKEGIQPETGITGGFYMKNCKESEKNLKLRFVVWTY